MHLRCTCVFVSMKTVYCRQILTVQIDDFRQKSIRTLIWILSMFQYFSYLCGALSYTDIRILNILILISTKSHSPTLHSNTSLLIDQIISLYHNHSLNVWHSRSMIIHTGTRTHDSWMYTHKYTHRHNGKQSNSQWYLRGKYRAFPLFTCQEASH